MVERILKSDFPLDLDCCIQVIQTTICWLETIQYNSETLSKFQHWYREKLENCIFDKDYQLFLIAYIEFQLNFQYHQFYAQLMSFHFANFSVN